jgi:ABC-2 type transport system ATP-binding protein
MIETMNLTKAFSDCIAVNDVSIRMNDKEVFGLLGTNGAGKSTLLRMLAGVMRQDKGTICIDREPVYDNPEVKENIFFIPNDYYYFPNATGNVMSHYIADLYPDYSEYRFGKMMKDFGLDPERRIDSFSKGMKKQLSIILGLCAGTKYIFCDETFDGLDPVMRQAVKSLFAKDMEDRGLTPVITSHNLREIEDICDHVGLLHQGGILLSEDMEQLKTSILKVQCVFASEEDKKMALAGQEVINEENRGRLVTLTIRGSRETIEQHFRGVNTVFFEVLPLTLEEVFISETEVVGYDIRKFILD